MNLRTRFERFCYQNQRKGIPNLMLYVVLGSAVVYLMTQMSGNSTLYELLRFDRSKILQGQVWRLITYVFTYQVTNSNFLLVAISLFCYYSLGRAMENAWGTFRFNLFYLCGIVLMDVYAVALGGIGNTVEAYGVTVTIVGQESVYADMVYYLNLSLFLGYATLYPDAHFLLFFIIPVKAWIFGLVDILLTLYSVISYMTAFDGTLLLPHSLFPLVAIGNYFLFFGKDVVNLIPMSWRIRISGLFRKKPKNSKKKTGTVPFPGGDTREAPAPKAKVPYVHRCTVCGRTDVSDPELEFRYCSRCNGYFCYCQDHISSHTHVE